MYYLFVLIFLSTFHNHREALGKDKEFYTFLDSEALMHELALYIEGIKGYGEFNPVGGVAFILLQVNKKTKKPINLFFGRNTYPLKLFRDKNEMLISSEGKGDDIDQHTLYKYNYKTKEITKDNMHLQKIEYANRRTNYEDRKGEKKKCTEIDTNGGFVNNSVPYSDSYGDRQSGPHIPVYDIGVRNRHREWLKAMELETLRAMYTNTLADLEITRTALQTTGPLETNEKMRIRGEIIDLENELKDLRGELDNRNHDIPKV